MVVLWLWEFGNRAAELTSPGAWSPFVSDARRRRGGVERVGMPTTQRLHRLVTTHRHGRAEDIFSNHPATALSAAIFNATDGLVQPTHDEKLDGFVMRASAGLFHCHLKKNAGSVQSIPNNNKLKRAARYFARVVMGTYL